MCCFIIAEAGVNHNGSLERAIELVDVAADAGADAVKFQTFRAEQLVVPGTRKAAYQQRDSAEEDQYEMLRTLELDAAAHVALKFRCEERGIEFMSTAFDLESLHFLVGLGMRRIKIPSGELTNLPLLRAYAAFDLPMILSTGMADLYEVRMAIDAIIGARSDLGLAAALDAKLCVLHCTSMYPAPPEAVNLRAMSTLAAEFGLPVGYSDHTLGLTVAYGAVALGACVIEKHFTLDCTLPGPDHAASLEPAALSELVAGIRELETALGSGEKKPSPGELEVREVARRSVILKRDVPAGHCLDETDLICRRPGYGISPAELEKVLGRRTGAALSAGHVLAWEDLV